MSTFPCHYSTKDSSHLAEKIRTIMLLNTCNTVQLFYWNIADFCSTWKITYLSLRFLSNSLYIWHWFPSFCMSQRSLSRHPDIPILCSHPYWLCKIWAHWKKTGHFTLNRYKKFGMPKSQYLSWFNARSLKLVQNCFLRLWPTSAKGTYCCQ